MMKYRYMYAVDFNRPWKTIVLFQGIWTEVYFWAR